MNNNHGNNIGYRRNAWKCHDRMWKTGKHINKSEITCGNFRIKVRQHVANVSRELGHAELCHFIVRYIVGPKNIQRCRLDHAKFWSDSMWKIKPPRISNEPTEILSCYWGDGIDPRWMSAKNTIFKPFETRKAIPPFGNLIEIEMEMVVNTHLNTIYYCILLCCLTKKKGFYHGFPQFLLGQYISQHG